ncbi:MAG: cation:proton antiporter [Prevotella sp.]|nr:cation:proton antiporter [Prevotella sp.]
MSTFASYFPITDPTLIFFVVLLIILFAPIIMGKLRIPHIIGMVLAGVLIGQYGLNILERDNSFELFGRVGLYYIMFLAGLEMDIEGVKKNVRDYIVFGLLTCLIPLGLTYLMAIFLLHYSPAAAFLLGCIMASNTLIAYPIIGRYGLQRHHSVMLSVGSSMISLFMALVMIAALSAVYGQNSLGGVWFWPLFVAKLALYIGAMLWVIPHLTRYFLRRYSDAVMQFIFVLAVMFLNAALTDLIGLEGIFGAFFSGIILNRYIPRMSALMNRLEFIGNALFIPYFLIGVGMLINVRSLFHGVHVLWIVGLIAFFGTFGKAVAAYLSSLLFRLPKADGHMMFGLTSAHAAGAIAMVMVGMRLEVAPGVFLVNDDMLNGVVLMILVTCIVSTLMTEHAAQQIVISRQHRDAHALAGSDTRAPSSDRILISVKYPEIASQLLSLALLVRNHQTDQLPIALNVVYDDANANDNREQGLHLLEQLQRQASASEVHLLTQVRLASNIANGIKHAFRESACTEVIMGMHVHTSQNAKFWGDFIQSLYNGLNRQIMLVRFVQPLPTLRRIRVAVPSRAEFEPGFHRWLERLCRLAGELDCRIEFHGRGESLALIDEYISSRHHSVRAEFARMEHWNELPQLAAHIADDQLFVVVTARKGTISYKNALDRLPDELQKYFSGKNLMIIFPDQYGHQKEDRMSFTEAQHHEENSIYDSIQRWIHSRQSANEK